MNNFDSDIFPGQNITKIYQRAIKLTFVCIIYIKFCLVELSYDLNIRLSLKKMVNLLTVPIVNLFDMFILKRINREMIKNSLYEKIQRILKQTSIRNNKLIDLFYQFGKHVDQAVIAVKQFSK